jgi:arylsulfatase A-like enzyme
MVKGVNGVGQRMPVFRKTGSRWVGIHGSRGTTHVPMVFRGPSVKKGWEESDPVRLHDILPTLCCMLGWEIPETAAGTVRAEILD